MAVRAEPIKTLRNIKPAMRDKMRSTPAAREHDKTRFLWFEEFTIEHGLQLRAEGTATASS
jgi:hypothetical protein